LQLRSKVVFPTKLLPLPRTTQILFYSKYS